MGRHLVRSVNGSAAGADGDVALDVGVKSVNGSTYDEKGAVTIGSKQLGFGFPDYSATSVSITNGWVSDDNGWLFFGRGKSASHAYVWVNKVQVWDSGSYDACYGSSMAPVSVGDVVTYDNLSWIIFKPCK